jgi:hypothetical protein
VAFYASINTSSVFFDIQNFMRDADSSIRRTGKGKGCGGHIIAEIRE